jgi:hypothetical protein
MVEKGSPEDIEEQERKSIVSRLQMNEVAQTSDSSGFESKLEFPYLEQADYRTACQHLSLEDLTTKLMQERTDLHKVKKILLPSLIKATDIPKGEKEQKVNRLNSAISSMEKRIEVLEELIYEKQQH